MSVFNFMTDEIQKLLEEWTVERNLRSKRPPVTDLRKFLNAGLITREQFLDELRGMGYHEKYISLYAQTLG
jgi:intein/homing endonuclease